MSHDGCRARLHVEVKYNPLLPSKECTERSAGTNQKHEEAKDFKCKERSKRKTSGKGNGKGSALICITLITIHFAIRVVEL